eukprot:1196381-Alexandrium_andersonii.AAC.1
MCIRDRPERPHREDLWSLLPLSLCLFGVCVGTAVRHGRGYGPSRTAGPPPPPGGADSRSLGRCSG